MSHHAPHARCPRADADHCAALGVLAGPAAGDTAPINPSDPKTPVTVSADALPTAQINGVVWQQAIVGTTVYAAGEFTTARPSRRRPGTQTVPRSNLMAYDLQTGQIKSGFAPHLLHFRPRCLGCGLQQRTLNSRRQIR